MDTGTCNLCALFFLTLDRTLNPEHNRTGPEHNRMESEGIDPYLHIQLKTERDYFLFQICVIAANFHRQLSQL